MQGQALDDKALRRIFDASSVVEGVRLNLTEDLWRCLKDAVQAIDKERSCLNTVMTMFEYCRDQGTEHGTGRQGSSMQPPKRML